MKKSLANLLPFISIALLGFFVYANTLSASFQYDDRLFIVENPAIKDIRNIAEMWNFFSSHSRFTALFSFALNYHFHRLNVFGYHLINLIIHIGSGFLLFWFTRLILFSSTVKLLNIQAERERAHKTAIALAAALIFIAHPVQTQAVTYISQRMASLAAFFYLLSLCLYIKGRLKLEKPFACSAFFAGSLLAGLCGMLTKETVITLPLAIFFTEACFFRPKQGYKSIAGKPLWGFIALTLLSLAVIPAMFSFKISQMLFTPRLSLSHGNEVITFGQYVLTQFRVLAVFLKLLVFPFHQNLDYDFPLSQHLFEPSTFLSFSIFLGGLVTAALLFKRHRLFSFGLFWFYLALLPNFVPRQHVIFEHKIYLASPGFCILAAAGLYTLLKNFKIYTAVLSVVILALSILSVSRNKVWRTEITLWSDVVQKSPLKASSRHNLGVAYAKSGYYERAVKELTRALELDPQLKQAYNYRGNVYLKLKQDALALADYQRALEIDPGFAQTHYNMGLLFQKKGQNKPALEKYQTTIELDPGFVQAYNNRSGIYIAQKQYELALADMTRAIELNPRLKIAYANRARLYGIKKEYSLALSDYDHILRIDQKDIKAHLKKAEIYLFLNDTGSALSEINRILKIDPGNKRASLLRLKILEFQRSGRMKAL